jgi:hypothetical protein
MGTLESDGATGDVVRRVEQSLARLESLNHRICDQNDGLASLNSSFRTYYPKLFSVRASLADSNDNTVTSSDEIERYRLLSELLMSDILESMRIYFYDELTQSNYATLQRLFLPIVMRAYNPPTPLCLPPKALTKLRTIGRKLDISRCLKISSSETDAVQSLTKFLSKLIRFHTDLQAQHDRMVAAQGQISVLRSFPPPEVLEKFSVFQRHCEIAKKLQTTISERVPRLWQHFDRLFTTRNEIDGTIQELLELHSEMHKYVKKLDDISKDFVGQSCQLRRFQVIARAKRDYEYFDYSQKADRIQHWSGLEARTPPGVLLSATRQLRNQLMEDIDFMTTKVAQKSKTVAVFPTKHPKVNSAPRPDLVRGRANSVETTKSVNCAFECINTDIDRAIEGMACLRDPIVALASLFHFFTWKKDLVAPIVAHSNLMWSCDVFNGLLRLVASRRAKIADIEKRKAKAAAQRAPKPVCNEPKAYTIAACGHTFCEKCLRECMGPNAFKCLVCQGKFGVQDIILIKWEFADA